MLLYLIFFYSFKTHLHYLLITEILKKKRKEKLTQSGTCSTRLSRNGTPLKDQTRDNTFALCLLSHQWTHWFARWVVGHSCCPGTQSLSHHALSFEKITEKKKSVNQWKKKNQEVWAVLFSTQNSHKMQPQLQQNPQQATSTAYWSGQRGKNLCSEIQFLKHKQQQILF